MPIFCYACEYCGHVFEELTNKRNKKVSFCPICEENGIASNAHKIVTTANFVVKGFNEKNGYSTRTTRE